MHRNSSLGTWLKHQRRKKGFTQAALAHHVGCARVTIQKIELDERRPSQQIVERLARALDIAPDEQRSLSALARGIVPPAAPLLPVDATVVPIPLTPLVGRSNELHATITMLERSDVRLLTLVGPPGVGKTRLAVQVADAAQTHFVDGVVFVPLATVQQSENVAEAIAQALGVHSSQNQSPVVALQTWLRHRQLLLLLDTLEHVLGAALLVRDLLQAAPGLKVLATSRSVLQIAGEHIYPVAPLALPDLARLSPITELRQVAAVELFVQRAQAVCADFVLTSANAASVAALCVRLDGLPLALELAAARLRLFSPAMLLQHLAQRLPLLSSSAPDAPARQQTLRAAIGWSYTLLSPIEQQVFRRLAVFVGGWTLAGAEAVGATAGGLSALIEQISALVNHSLVQVTNASGDLPRCTMLELIYEYAGEQLAACGEQSAAQRQHALFYTEWAEQMQPRCFGAEQQATLACFETEYPNLRAALEWSVTQQEFVLAARLASALWPFWYDRSATREGQAWLERIVALAARLPVGLRARLFFAAGMVCQRATAFTTALAYFDSSVAFAREDGTRWGEAAGLLMGGISAQMHGDASIAHARVAEAAPLVDATGDWWLHALLLLVQGEQLLYLGAFTAALPVLETGLALTQARDDAYISARTLICVARAALGMGDLPRAYSLCRQGLALSQQLHNDERVADATNVLGRVLLRQGDAEQATAAFRTSLCMYRDLDHREGMTWCIEGWACAAAAQQQWQAAAQLWGAAAALHIQTGRPLPPAEHAEYAPVLAVGRAALGDDAFTAAWQEGELLPLETMLAHIVHQ